MYLSRLKLTHDVHPRCPPTTHQTFFGEFGDAFVEDTSLEGGHIPPTIRELCGVVENALTHSEFRAALSLFSDDDTEVVRTVTEKLKVPRKERRREGTRRDTKRYEETRRDE